MENKHIPLKENYENLKKDKLLNASERPPNPPASSPINNKIVYIADIDQDIDDIIAAEYLFLKNKLDCIVLDPLPNSQQGKDRVNTLKNMGIKVLNNIPINSKYIFVGGAFTKLATYIKTNDVDLIVANGGYVGSHLMRNPLEKFIGKKAIRTYNFNLDVDSTISVVNSNKRIILIGKNVCHSIRNTIDGIWQNEVFLKKYNLRNTKRLHDLLMVSEGLKFIDGIESEFLKYQVGKPKFANKDNSYTEWYTDLKQTNSNIMIAIDWRN